VRRQIVDGQRRAVRWQGALEAALACLCLLLTGNARAQTSPSCGPPERAWIAIQTPERAPHEQLDWQDVVRHVAGELSVRGVDLCTLGKSTRPLARLRLASETATRVRITLVTGDTEQRLAARSLELGSVPDDARLLAIAVATDELLAANWREVERRAHGQLRPQETTNAAPPVPTPLRDEPRFELGPVFAFDSFAGGQRLLGVDARGALRFGPRLALTARAGLRQGLPRAAPHGSLHATALLGGLGLRLELSTARRLRLDLFGRADALRLGASAYASSGATDRSETGVAIVTLGGLDLRLLLSRSVRVLLEAGAGGAPRPVHITDAGQRVSGVSGLAITLGGGVNATF
jgi:hypothetical protein